MPMSITQLKYLMVDAKCGIPSYTHRSQNVHKKYVTSDTNLKLLK